jgi:dephospho-CoA kinase
VIDVDGLGHEALADEEVRAAVAREFGARVAAADGSLDREKLARVAFASDESRRKLESIVHPVVRSRIDAEIRRARADRAPLVVVDCALLFESGLDADCGSTVVVDAPEPIRLARAASARGWSADETRRRAAAQLTAEEKRARADRVVVNDGDEARLAREAQAVFEAVVRGDPADAGTRRSKS